LTIVLTRQVDPGRNGDSATVTKEAPVLDPLAKPFGAPATLQ
jgi:hypothetical protein